METPHKKPRYVTDITGDWGPWQRSILLFVFTLQLFSPLQTFGINFFAPHVHYNCNTPFHSNKSQDACSRHYVNGSEACTGWDYDNGFFESTIISEWDLVCDRAYLISATKSLYMVGVIVASLVSGHMSDNFGRLPTLWASLAIELLAGLSCALSYSMTQYMVSRFFLAVGVYTKFLTAFLLIMECIGTRNRTTIAIIASFGGWSCGQLILPGIAYWLRHFRYIQLVITLPEVLWLFWLWFIPESPRWLLAHGHLEKAHKALEKAALKNGKPVDHLNDDLMDLRMQIVKDRKSPSRKKPNISDLFKTRGMRNNTLLLSFTWFVTAFVYYGYAFNFVAMGGSLFITMLVSAVTEVIADGLCLFGLRRFSRRKLLFAVLVGVSLGALIAVPFYFLFHGSNITSLVFTMLSKFFITCSFIIIYIMSAEIYPTVIRQIGIGSNSAVARIGAIISPFIYELTQFTHISVALVIFGALTLLNSFLVLLLPETKGREIPDTIEGAKDRGRNIQDVHYNNNNNNPVINYTSRISFTSKCLASICDGIEGTYKGSLRSPPQTLQRGPFVGVEEVLDPSQGWPVVTVVKHVKPVDTVIPMKPHRTETTPRQSYSHTPSKGRLEATLTSVEGGLDPLQSRPYITEEESPNNMNPSKSVEPMVPFTPDVTECSPKTPPSGRRADAVTGIEEILEQCRPSSPVAIPANPGKPFKPVIPLKPKLHGFNLKSKH